MKINKPQHRRLQLIDRMIRSGKYPNASTIAKSREIEVDPRTIRRDIEYMRDLLEAPIEYDSTRKGYYYSEKNYFLPALDIKESDFFAICITEKALKQYENTPLYEKLETIFSKLKEYLPDSVRVNTSWIDTQYTFMHESFTHIKPEVWETVSNSLRQRKQLSISHRKAGAEEAVKRTVEPYHIVNFRGEWYLVAYCRMRKAVLRFAMSRIQKADLMNTAYIIPDDFNFSSFIGSSFGIMTDDPEQTVRILFDKDQAPYIIERQWHHGQVITENSDGSVILSFTTNSLYEVKKWLLSWGASATVLEPIELVKQIKDEVKGMMGNYK